MIVSGTSVIGADDPKEVISTMRQEVEHHIKLKSKLS